MNENARPPLVLVVDDNRVNRQLARAFLERDGWSVQEAEDGEQALSRLQGGGFDAVLLDISMPGRSGIDVLHDIRTGPHGGALFAVAYTAHAMGDELSTILKAGFDDILIKPISRQAMTETFNRCKQQRIMQ